MSANGHDGAGDTARYERLIRQAYRKIQELEAELGAARRRQQEPIAVIGLGCRVPSAEGPEAFWRLLRDGVDATREAPPERWPGWSRWSSETPGEASAWRGGFLSGLDAFDPLFFGISAREARSLDPQQRLLLEVCWEALEHAGIAASSLLGSATGVFVGIMGSDYGHLLLGRDPAEFDAYQATGTSSSVASGRLSYTFGFQGPTLTVDTACSSSLVAVHQAAQSLRRGECDLALAGGVNVILSPRVYLSYARTTALSPDGRCKTFSARADGFGRGEGAGVVVLRRLSDALARGDRILAVIRGSAINHDGRVSGLTVPNGPAQQEVLRAALRDAGVRPAEVGFVEAHGTGTSLGDPIEIGALGAVYGRDREAPLWVGAVKTNLGHLEGSAGVASLIKAILSLVHEEIPPNLHFDEPSPHIDWEAARVRVPTARVPWPAGGARRVAGVSSFGISGTNAHLIVEEAPRPEAAAGARGLARSPHLLPLSARSEASLAALIARYRDHLAAHPDLDPADVCATAACGRVHFEHRLAAVGRTTPELRAALDEALHASAAPGVVRGRASGRRGPRVAFLCAGQGGQYPSMGRALYQSFPAFRAAMDRCDELLAPELGGASLRALLYPDDSPHDALAEDPRLGQTLFTQPALFALQYALAQLWISWGIEPDALMGHSAGEYVAACLAGVFSLEDGLRLIAARGRLMHALPPLGLMAAVMAPGEEVAAAIADAGRAGEVSLAALNGPQNTVISGERGAVEALLRSFAARGVESKALDISIASHSPLMEAMLPEFQRIAETISYHPPRLRLISNLSGAEAGEEIARPGYWVEHIRRPVRFAAGMAALLALDIGAFVEIGPRSTLLGLAQPCLGEAAEAALWLPSLRRSQGDLAPVLESLARLYTRGARVDWEAFAKGGEHRKISLPTYPFERERHWIDAAHGATVTGAPGLGGAAPPVHPLLGREARTVALEAGALLFEGTPGLGASACLGEHRVRGEALMPAAAYVEMALAAGSRALPGAQLTIAELTLPRGLLLSAERSVQTLLTPTDRGYRFVIASLDAAAPAGAAWVEHASGRIEPAQGGAGVEAGPADLEGLRARCAEELDIEQLYGAFAALGIDYGPSFRGVARIWKGDGEALGRLSLPADAQAEAGAHGWHPALLDAALQVSLAAIWEGRGVEPYLPTAIEACRLAPRAPGPALHCHAKLRSVTERSRLVDLVLLGDAGEELGTIRGLYLRRASQDALTGPERWRAWLYAPAWRARALALAPESSGPAVSPSAIGDRVRARWPQGLDGSEGGGLGEYGEAFTELESLSVDFIRRGLEALGLSFARGSRWPKAGLAESLAIAPRHRRLFARLLQILAEAAVIADRGEAFEVIAPEARPEPVDGLRRLAARAGASLGSEPELLARCGPRLPQLLRGGDDPLRLLFEDGDLSAAAQLYERSPHSARMNQLVEAVVAALIERLPPGGTLRILEIGAGTGAIARALAPRLASGRIDYLFTDISPLFLQRARAQLGAAPSLRTQLLDIERSPEAQGFLPGQADLVIASNVLHATQDLGQALDHVRWLLAPGGLLVLVEATRPQRWADITFGLLDGWWRFADRRRSDYPLLGVAPWQELLRERGFDAVEPWTVSASIDAAAARRLGPVASEQTLFLARRAAGEGASPPAPWLILGDRSGMAERLVEELGARGERAVIARWEEGLDLDRWLGSMGAAQGVVHLVALDGRAHPDSAEALEADARHVGGSLLHLAQALARRGAPPPLWIVTRGALGARASGAPKAPSAGPAQSLLWGMARSIHEEHPDLRLVRIDLDPCAGADAAGRLCDELLRGDGETEIAHRGAERLVARLAKYPAPPAEGGRLPLPDADEFRLEITERGSLDHLALRPVQTPPPGPGEVQIRVHATGLNFRDILNALGEYPGDPGHLGNECSGEIVALGADVEGLSVGDRVCALAHGSFARAVNVDARLVAKLGRLGMAEGATLPVAFLTAAYGLRELAALREGERVLIHAASGGVGQAAIQLALRAGAEVFATASPAKWGVVRALGVTRLYDSRSLDFADSIRRDTGGEGVHVVLNSLTGPGFVEESLAALGARGRFVEISKRNIWDVGEVRRVRPDVHYWTVDLGEVRAEEPALIARLLGDLMPELGAGRLRPLPRTLFDIEDAVAAFRTMQQALHTGKIVITQATPPCAPAAPGTFALREEGAYLITGGLGGLGLAVAAWMVERGARHLVLLGRSAPAAPAQRQIDALRARGARVEVALADVADVAALAGVLGGLDRPLRGVMHCAGVLDDGLLVNQTWGRFERVLAPKLAGAWNLHLATQSHPLDFFVCFSSATSLLGTAGQANHAAANAFLDELAHHRQALGLPGLSVGWGAWSEIGAAAAQQLDEHLARKGIGTISPREGIEALRYLMDAPAPHVGVIPVDWATFLGRLPEGRRPPFFSELGREAPPRPVAEPPRETLRERIERCAPGEMGALLSDYLAERVSQLLGIRRGQLAPDRPLNQLGLDSLMAVELKHHLKRDAAVDVPMTELLDDMTVARLTELLLARAPGVAEGAAGHRQEEAWVDTEL